MISRTAQLGACANLKSQNISHFVETAPGHALLQPITADTFRYTHTALQALTLTLQALTSRLKSCTGLHFSTFHLPPRPKSSYDYDSLLENFWGHMSHLVESETPLHPNSLKIVRFTQACKRHFYISQTNKRPHTFLYASKKYYQ